MSIPIAKSMTPLAKSMTPALRASIPHRKICHICRRQMSIPPRHLWRGGGRQAGGEVKRAGDEVKIYKNEKRPKLNSFDHFLKKTREK